MKKELENYYAEIRFDYGAGYQENDCERIPLVEEMVVTISLDNEHYPKTVRVDPSNNAVLLKWIKAEAKTATGTCGLPLIDIVSNAQNLSDDELLFNNSDPQMLITLPTDERWQQIEISYQIIIFDFKKVEPYFLKYKEKNMQEIKRLEFTINEQSGKLHECAIMMGKSQKEHEEILRNYKDTLKKYNDTLRKYNEKLKYIENSKAYRLFLKSKVDKVFRKQGKI